MVRRVVLMLLLAAAVLAHPVHVHAQSQVPNTLLLDDPSGIRTMSMGESGVADNGDAANVWLNPANVVARPRVYLRGATFEWAGDIVQHTGSAGGGWRSDICSRTFVFGADFTAGIFDADDVVRTVYLPGGTGDELPNWYYGSLALGAGTVFDERWDVRFGTALKRLWEEDTAQDPISGIGFDFGATVAYAAPASDWRITPAAAIAFANLGGPLAETGTYVTELPARFNYGFSVRVESPPVKVAGEQVPLFVITGNLDGVDRFYGPYSSWSFGSEIALAQILFLRAGGIQNDDVRFGGGVSYRSSLGVGLGVPFSHGILRFDYAKIPVLWEPHRYGLYLQFGSL